ncbi:beta-glucosidase [Sinimarinibacterium sp. NLF-5-8]|uniref:beta-glucosidase family protein n=1 Tax=Sinimarinibacterium sp. NLF-5-8 TaxID=2698684 RepID=UPI00137BACA5|nr:glycoside hydrolase family 3 C-terminal domain-containing protein [Sinimarinibacterium sp. NLF-5-8]QHS11258.1 glycosyl hydrolase [Sinimarinibacterium sp. NLF-5-8]
MRSVIRSVWVVALLTVVGCGGGTDHGTSPLTLGASRCGNVAERPWCDARLDPAERTRLLLAAMTLSQKIDLMAGDHFLGVATSDPATGTVNGIPELGIPPLYMSDGPAGTREGISTAFPAPIALGASFNPELAYDMGKVIGREVRLKGNDLVHGPTVDIMRTGLAGRTFETYGEDPYLATRLGVRWIDGAQSEHVIGNVKHYLLNNQEGQVGAPPLLSLIGGRHLISAMVDERTLREIYLPPFEAAVKEAGVGSVMCAYNLINLQPACSHRHLLQGVLRDEWGFDGFVVSDYLLAVKDTVMSINNGNEIEMPVGFFYQPAEIQLAVATGLVSEATIDVRVGNILRTLFRFGFFDRADFPSDDGLIDYPAGDLAARRVAEEGMVLLKNNGVLPLNSATRSIAIIGKPATTYHNVGGSAAVTPWRYTSAVDAITARAGSNVTVTYDDGSQPARAAARAAAADVALVFVGDNAKEGTDKTCLALDCPPFWMGPLLSSPQKNLIEAVVSANPHTVVLLELGGPILTPWRDRLAGLLTTWYGGQATGSAVALVLFGDTDPGGRLPVTFPDAESQTPTAGNFLQYPGQLVAQYSEGVFIGYRWYDHQGIAPAYPFGFGLSYTTFAASDLTLNLVDGRVRATWQITNTGTRAGSTVGQVYLGKPMPEPGVEQPPSALNGFRKVTLAAGASQTVSVDLDDAAFAYWSESQNGWRVADGCYTIRVGFSSRDLPLTAALERNGTGWRIQPACR